MKATAVVVAAGRGTRLDGAGGDLPKALVEIAGRPMLAHCLTNVRATVGDLVVVHPPGDERAFREVAGDDVVLVGGGDTRSASVRAGVAACPPDTEVVAIHDAARPLVPPVVFARALEALTTGVVAAAPGLPVTDTLKRVVDDTVAGTVGRDGLWMVHTPQVIRRDILDTVLDWAGDRGATDDLALVEEAIAAGVVAGRIRIVRGDPRDLKITVPEDLTVAAALVAGTSP